MAGEKAACWRPGKEGAFLALIKDVEGELSGFIQHRVGSRDAAQDILQKTLVLAWGHATFDPTHAHARAWLFTTARRLVIDWLESEDSRSISLEDLSERALRDESRGSRSALQDNRACDPVFVIIREERARYLNAALGRLREDQREILERYYLRREGSQSEIAQAMGLSVAAFNSRLNRARIELKRAILILRARDGWSGHDPF
jgi:RNA polymerase sigma-70 factor (ECF subfamily)